MHIRIATGLDQGNIHSVHWSAFAEGEREIISNVAVNLALHQVPTSSAGAL